MLKERDILPPKHRIGQTSATEIGEIKMRRMTVG